MTSTRRVGAPDAPETVAVCVFCSSSERIDPAHIDLAEHVGQALVGRGWTLVSGGGAVSMMGAVARAVRAAGGRTVGVIPAALVALEVADHDADELVVTAGMRERKAVMDERSHAFLALPGGIGTLEELLEIWVARSLGLHDKPVVVLDPDGVFDPLRAQVEQLVAAGFIRPGAAAELVWTRTVSAAFDALADALCASAAGATELPGAPGDQRGSPPAEEFLEAQP